MRSIVIPSLRTTLLADSGVCFVYGALLAIAPRLLSTLFTTEAIFIFDYTFEAFLRVLGVGTIAVGVGVCMVSCAKQIVPLAVWLIVGIEVIWIIGCILLLVCIGSKLALSGVAFIVVSAMVVFGFMVVELFGLRSLYRNRAATTT